MRMSDTLRLPESAPTRLGWPGAVGMESGHGSGGHRLSPTRLALGNLAGQVRFAFGEAEERRILGRGGFTLWQCNVAGGYIHTQPGGGGTNALTGLPGS